MSCGISAGARWNLCLSRYTIVGSGSQGFQGFLGLSGRGNTGGNTTLGGSGGGLIGL